MAERFYREAPAPQGTEPRYDEDGLHIYWFDPVEGCWVAFRRVDCVGEEELPEHRLPASVAPEEPEVEWEYGCRSSAHVMSNYKDRGALVLQDLEHATEHGFDCPSPSIVRRPRAGDWEFWLPASPLEGQDMNQTTSEGEN